MAWRWWVEEVQPDAELTEKSRHDVGASIFVVFGDPGVFRDRRVPTLQYVWTNRRVERNRVIVGPYREKYLRTIVVRRGAEWDGPVDESRDVFSDFQRAFGESPEDGVHAVALFTDNDDTG